MMTDTMMTRVLANTESVSVTSHCGIGSAKKTQNTAVLQQYNITASSSQMCEKVMPSMHAYPCMHGYPCMQ